MAVQFQGLSSAAPVAEKSASLRVTTVSPCTSAVAAISPSRSGLGSGTVRRAQHRAISVVTGSVRPANSGSTCASNLFVCIANFSLVANAGDHDPVQGIVPRIARQVAAASAGDDQFTQTTFHRAANAGLMRQHLQCIQDEIEQFPSQGVFGLVQKRFQAQQILECR